MEHNPVCLSVYAFQITFNCERLGEHVLSATKNSLSDDFPLLVVSRAALPYLNPTFGPSYDHTIIFLQEGFASDNIKGPIKIEIRFSGSARYQIGGRCTKPAGES
jgi:hypothetical protein